MRVVIIGGGLGGLCLLHGLRKRGIDAEVYERNASASVPPASYGIHLNRDGLTALHDCLPAENWAHLVAGTTIAPDVVRFWDSTLRPLATLDHETPTTTGDPLIRRRAVPRNVLHAALMLGVEDRVHWGKQFVEYRSTANAVEAHFADGTHATGDVLVGADGASSRVRKQRLPHLDRIDLEIANVAGRLPLTQELLGVLPSALVDGSVNNIVPHGAGWMFMSTWPTREAQRYLVWAWAARESAYPFPVATATPEQLRDVVIEHVDEWARPVRRVIASTPLNTINIVKLRTMPALSPWEPDNVTLLGDAIHNMTPMAGIGANTALRDAAALSLAVAASGSTVSRVGLYEQTMRAYANVALATSTRNARKAASDGSVGRTVFRTLLRLGGALSPVRHLVFHA